MINNSKNQHYDFTVACCRNKHGYKLSEVIRLEASSNYTLIYAVNRRPVVIAKVLADYKVMLKDLGFIRVHRSHLLNKNFVNAIDGAGNIVMHEGFSVGIPCRKKE